MRDASEIVTEFALAAICDEIRADTPQLLHYGDESHTLLARVLLLLLT